MVTIAFALLAREPRLQVTVAVPLQEPCVVVAETKVTPDGSVSVRFTFVAEAGPLFVSVSL
jgi:hypothetical protein